MAGGRPSQYKEEYCAKVIELMRQGYPWECVAAELGYTVDCINEWARKYPEFGLAKKTGRALSLRWWIDKGRAGMESHSKFNAAVWIFTMKNMFGWMDRTASEIEQTSKIEMKSVDKDYIIKALRLDPFTQPDEDSAA